MFVERRYESIINESGIRIFDRPRTPAMRETRVLCRSIRTRSIREQTSKAVPWRCDLSRLRNTRAKSAPRSVCTALRGWRNCARDRSNEHARMVRTRGSHTSFSSKIPVSAPEAARNDEIAGWIAMWCARARYIVNTYIHTYVLTLTRAKRTTAFLRGERVSVPQSRCQGQAPRSRLPAHLLATAFRIELPTLLLDRAKRS